MAQSHLRSRGQRYDRWKAPRRSHPGGAPGRRASLRQPWSHGESPTVSGLHGPADARPVRPIPRRGADWLAIPLRQHRPCRRTPAMGSDWPVTTPDPLKEIEVAVTRLPHGKEDGEPFLPHERLSLEQALKALTAGSAFANHLDDRTGTIEGGQARRPRRDRSGSVRGRSTPDRPGKGRHDAGRGRARISGPGPLLVAFWPEVVLTMSCGTCPLDRADLELVLAPIGFSRTLPAGAYVSEEVLAWERRHFFEGS